MVNAILWSIAQYCTAHNLGFMQTLEYERTVGNSLQSPR